MAAGIAASNSGHAGSNRSGRIVQTSRTVPVRSTSASPIQMVDSADDDPWRKRLRAVRGTGDRAALEQLAREVDVADQPPQILILLERALHARGSGEAVALLRAPSYSAWHHSDPLLAPLRGYPPFEALLKPDN